MGGWFEFHENEEIGEGGTYAGKCAYAVEIVCRGLLSGGGAGHLHRGDEMKTTQLGTDMIATIDTSRMNWAYTNDS